MCVKHLKVRIEGCRLVRNAIETHWIRIKEQS